VKGKRLAVIIFIVILAGVVAWGFRDPVLVCISVAVLSLSLRPFLFPGKHKSGGGDSTDLGGNSAGANKSLGLASDSSGAREIPPGRASVKDTAFAERIAGRITELNLAVPAIMALESAKPLTFVASQALVFFDPVIRIFVELKDYRKLIDLLEDRQKVEELILALERNEELRCIRGEGRVRGKQ
jgi:hypothetical protein